jgi:NB-ARC domain/APAF-1 helical domain/WD domain, G-beta repeat
MDVVDATSGRDIRAVNSSVLSSPLLLLVGLGGASPHRNLGPLDQHGYDIEPGTSSTRPACTHRPATANADNDIKTDSVLINCKLLVTHGPQLGQYWFMREHGQENEMRRGVRDAVRDLLQGGGDALHRLSRPTLRTVLCAGAFAPVVATAEGSGATAVAGIAVLGGVGTNILSEIISSAIDKKRQRREGRMTERQCQDELKSDIAEKLETGDAESNQLEEEIDVVLRQVGVGRELIWAALDAPGEHSMNLLLEQLTRLALELERFSFIFEGMAAVAEELVEELEGSPDHPGWDDRAAELYWKRSKIIELLSLRRPAAGIDETGETPLGAWMVPGTAGNSVSRPALLRAVTELLYQDDNPAGRVISIEGTAGFGKTTLAIQACHDGGMKVRYPGGILWVTVGRDAGDASITESISRLHEVITGNRLTSADASVAAAQLGSQLDQIGSSLLVIDDVWSASQLAPFLIGGSQCTRLITTRNVGVAPTGSPTVIVDQMSDDESLQLLVRGTTTPPSGLTSQLLGASGRWPILLNLINGVLVELTNSGATSTEAARWALTKLGDAGPTAFDWDVNDESSRDRAVRLTIETSLSLLPAAERLRYLQLSATPRGKQIPMKVLYLLWADRGYDEARTALVRATFIRLRLATGCWIDGGPGLYLHDILHEYAHYSLSTDEITATHLNFVANARNLISFAEEFELSSTRTGRASPWWALLDDPSYLWEFVPWHLAQANLTDELRDLLVDLRWVASKIRRTGSAAAVEIDLRLSAAQEVSLLLKVVQQSAHLLRADDGYPTISTTLLSRVEHVKGLELSTDFFRRTLNGARLEAQVELPDAPSEAVRYVFDDNSARVNSVSVSPDGLLVVPGANDGAIRIWNVSDADREVKLIHEDTTRIQNVGLSPDRTVLASCSDNASATIWSLLEDRPALKARITGINATAGVFSPDGHQLALGGKDGSLAIYDTKGELLRRAGGMASPLHVSATAKMAITSPRGASSM